MANKVGLDSIKFDKSNANKGTVRGRGMIESSIREFGFADAGTLDKNNVIIGGNKRTEVAGEIGMDEAIIIDVDGTKPVFIRRPDMDLSDPEDDKARRLAYILNRSSEVSLSWDAEQLLADMTAGVDLSNIFNQSELDELLAGLVAPEPAKDVEPQIDKADELRQKWGVELGQMWQLGTHRIICGDCTDKATVDRLMQGEKADAVVTDPPYAVFGSSTGIGRNITDDKMILPFCREVFSVAVRVTNVNAHVYIHCDWKSFNAWWSQLDRFDLRPLNCIVWDKGDGGIGTNYTNKHEFILFLNREPKQTTMTGGGGNMRLVYGIANVQRFNIQQGENRLHNAAKPVELESVFIGASTDIGGIVFEPFSGSGTTIIACEQLGRRCRAMEISPAYVAVALERWSAATNQTPILLS